MTNPPAGNHYDKYHTRNPIARHLMNGFLQSFDVLLETAGQPRRVLETGCGEGELSIRVARATNAPIRSFDISAEVVDEARRRAAAAGLESRISFDTASIYNLSESDKADLVVCCEVLEHLEFPDQAIDKLASVCNGHLIVSVPREPLWRMLNMARGKYWSDLGNTPGHVQHWSSSGFRQLLDTRFEIIELRKPIPWTMALCRRRPL